MKYEDIKLPSDEKIVTLILAVASAKKKLQEARNAKRREQTIDELVTVHISAQVQVIVGVLELNLMGSLLSPPPPRLFSLTRRGYPTTQRTGTLRDASCAMFFGSCVQDSHHGPDLTSNAHGMFRSGSQGREGFRR